MGLILNDDHAEKLLKEVYQIVNNPKSDLNSSREMLESRLKQVIDLSWKSDNSFNAYYNEFSKVISAMYQLDFSQRLTENDDKESFLNFIAKTMNLVCEKLGEEYLGIDHIKNVMDALKVKNRMVILSRDKKTISAAFSNVTRSFNPDALLFKPLNTVIDQATLDDVVEEEKRQTEYECTLDKPYFNKYKRRNVHIRIVNKDIMAITFTFSPEDSSLIENKGRILDLIRSMKEQYDDEASHSQTVNDIVRKAEVMSLYEDLKDLIEKERS